MLKKLSCTLLFIGLSFSCFCQANRQMKPFSLQLKVYEDSLKRLGKLIVNGKDETDRRAATYKFIPLLVKALKIEGSFEYPFDSVKTIRITVSPDRRFRIFNWFVNINDIAYRFYGAIQMNTPGRLELFPLIDASETIAKPEDTLLTPKKWLGAEYYSILPPDAKGNYVLLGWKGYSAEMTERLIDVLHFEAGKPVFGAPLFRLGGKVQQRIIFRYTHQASMMLRYLPARNLIVFDHLAPPDAKLKGRFDSYGPDLSYDDLRFDGKVWNLQENVNLANEESEKDKQFITPDKAPVIR